MIHVLSSGTRHRHAIAPYCWPYQLPLSALSRSPPVVPSSSKPAMLERIDSCRTVIFDKTGTLTYGRPALTETICAPGVSRDHAIQIAGSLEQYSKHPLAASILEAARQSKIEFAAVSEISEKPGAGLSGAIGAAIVQITGRKKVPASATAMRPPVAPGMECILMLDGKYGATFRFRDAPRQESRSFISHLGPKHQVSRVILLSGDREAEVRYLAGQVGITETLVGKSPEEKVAIVMEEAKRAPTLFVGDGIKDAPVMQAATVGIAFGQNSDVTAEAADAVVLEASLRKVDELIHIGRRMRKIAPKRSRRHGVEHGWDVDGGSGILTPGCGRGCAGADRCGSRVKCGSRCPAERRFT